jgi:hypothetical protein
VRREVRAMDNVFIPKGYALLLSAVDRLARARQMPIESAQAEIRTELYERSIVAYAIEQSTGRMIEMISESWATKSGLLWLEKGMCLLPTEDGEVRITTERFGMFYEPEYASIVISEKDLQRLISTKASAGARLSAPAISNADAKRRFDEWRESRGDNIPSEAEDYAHMMQLGVSRERVRALRQGVTNRARGKARSTKT